MSDFKNSRDDGSCQKKTPVSYESSHKKSIDLIKNLWIWVCKHPGVSGVFVTAFGGVTILSYLLPLGFVPDFELTAVLGLLLLAAFLGVLQLTIIGGGLMVPAIIGKNLISDIEADGKPFNVAAAVLVSTFIWLVVFGLDMVFNKIWTAPVLVIAICFTVVLAIVCSVIKNKEKWKRRSIYALLFVLQGVNFLLAIMIFTAGAQTGLSGMEGWLQWGSLIAWCVFVSTANLVLLQWRVWTPGGVMFVGTLLVWVLIWLSQSFFYMNGITIRKLRLGDINGTTITVTESAASAIQAACLVSHAPRSCIEQEIKRGTTTAYVYENVKILSRLGNQYYLQLCQHEDTVWPCGTVSGVRVAIEKKDVIGWSTKEPPKRGEVLEEEVQTQETSKDKES